MFTLFFRSLVRFLGTIIKTQFRDWNQDYYYHNILTREAGKASECIRCGKCEKICPQHLPVRELLKSVAAEFEQVS